MMFTARYDNEGRPQSLETHLKSVARIASTMTRLQPYGEISGLLHDIGKYSRTFRDYLKNAHNGNDQGIHGKVDHSSAGAQYILEIMQEKAKRTDDPELQHLSQLIGRIIAHCVAAHHSGLLNGLASNDGPSLEKRLHKMIDSYKDTIAPEIREKIEMLADTLMQEDSLESVCQWIDEDANVQGRDAYSLQTAIRMIFSALVDADRLHSEESGDPDQWQVRLAIQTEAFSILLDKLENYLNTLSNEGYINEIRRQVSDACRAAANQEQGFFQLTVPTGGGKTLSSLRFALHHVIKHTLKRIIYVMPYTSIIDQNAGIFRDLLDADGKTKNVLEHHSNLEPKEETPKSRLLAENWTCPVVVTTNVQFFESLYTNRPSRCRRLHSIRNSVIILDEAQTIPVRFLQAITWALEELVENHGCSVVLCTATQPVLDSSKIDREEVKDNHRIGLKNLCPIIDRPAALYSSLKRVDFQLIKSKNPLCMPEVAGRIAEHADKGKSILSIVNTKKNAISLFTELRQAERFMGRLFHLSTAMCPQHRRDVIEILKQMTSYYRNIGAHAPIVVSTQLVEAGVNLDFDVVFRSMAGVDSIVQAAGRCNREGALLPKLGEIYVYEANEELGNLIDIIEAKRAGINALSAITKDPSLSNDEKEPLGLKTIEEYFERLYWSRRKEMDKERIIGRLAASRQLEHAADIPFADIASDFRLIKEDTVSVLVPYGARGKRLITDLKNGKPLEFEMIRVAQQHSVQLYRSVLPAFRTIVEETPSGWLVVDSSVHYGEIGLKRPYNIEVEDYM